MEEKLLAIIKSTIHDAIQEKVNGKIDGLRHELSEYIKDDTAWKVDAQPTIEAFKNAKGAYTVFKIFVAIILGLSAVAGFFKLIK